MSKKVLYKELNAQTNNQLTAEEQEDPYLMLKVLSTKLVGASDNDVICGAKYFNKHKKCKYHFIYDEPSFMYDFRYCGICGKFIAMI